MIRTLFLPLLTLLLVACATETENENVVENSETELTEAPKDFNDFYEKFHTDSIYQKAHILFPLQGIPSNADSAALADKTFRWEADSWVIQNRLPANSDFSSTIIPVDEGLVIENITHQSGEYAMERRFAKMNGEWKLIYYAGVNRVKK